MKESSDGWEKSLAGLEVLRKTSEFLTDKEETEYPHLRASMVMLQEHLKFKAKMFEDSQIAKGIEMNLKHHIETVNHQWSSQLTMVQDDNAVLRQQLQDLVRSAPLRSHRPPLPDPVQLQPYEYHRRPSFPPVSVPPTLLVPPRSGMHSSSEAEGTDGNRGKGLGGYLRSRKARRSASAVVGLWESVDSD